jgi:AraC-like DNA-binding protein
VHQVRAASLYSYLDVASSVGIDGRQLLVDEGISPLSLNDIEARLPASAVVSLLERSAQRSGLDSFGVRMAQCRSFASLGPLSLLIGRLNTIGEAVDALSVLRRSLTDVLSVSTQHSGDRVSVIFDLIAPHGRPQATDLAVGLGYLALAGASQNRWTPDSVHFMHPAPTDRAPFEHFFKVPLRFADNFNGFSLSRASWEMPLPLADPRTAQDTRHLLSLMRAPVSDHARQAISLLLPMGEATIVNVASSLYKSKERLQRELKGEGNMFTSLVNEVRITSAKKYLHDSDVDISDMPELLGYNNYRSFAKWFEREFGTSPDRWRAKPQGGDFEDHPEIIFSLKDGDVVASWSDLRAPINLGDHEMVMDMMNNYINQTRVAAHMLSGSLELL